MNRLLTRAEIQGRLRVTAEAVRAEQKRYVEALEYAMNEAFHSWPPSPERDVWLEEHGMTIERAVAVFEHRRGGE